MARIVQKYGGSSVANPERIRRVAQRVKETREQGNEVIVVVSALGHTTDELIKLASQITDRPPKREMDMLLSTGEQVSIALMAMAVNALGLKVVSFTGAQCGVITDNMHTKARILRVEGSRIEQALREGRVVVAAGFQGIDSDNDITTLGRGGSDTTAVALAAASKADVCEIYTDVDGVYTADPRLVKDASKLPEISFGEMLEMASLGAVVLQPRAVEFAAQWGVKIHVRSSFSNAQGTIVREAKPLEKERVVSGVAHDKNVAKLAIIDVPDRPGVAHRIFSLLAEEGINVDMIVQTTKESNITDLVFTVNRDELGRAREIAQSVSGELGATRVLWDDRVGKVSIIGAGMVTNPGVAARMFQVLAENNVNIQVISTSEIKVSCLIDEASLETAVRAIHQRFGLGSGTAVEVEGQAS